MGNAKQSSVNSLRKSVDSSKAILKWDGETPSVFSSMTTYNHSEILTILATEEWTADLSNKTITSS